MCNGGTEMNVTAYDIAFVFSELFTLYSIKLFFGVFFNVNKSFRYFTMGSYALYFAVTVLLHFFIKIPVANLILNVILLFIIALCYEATIRKRIIAVSECYFIMFTAELLISATTQSAYIKPLEKYEYSNILGLFLSRMLIFLTVLIINRIADLKRNKIIPYWLYLSSLAVPIFTVSIEILFMTTNGTTSVLVVTSMLLLFSINILVFFLLNSLTKYYEQSLKASFIKQEREYYKKQCEVMQKSSENLRSIKHDLTNHFTVIDNLLDSNNVNEATNYLHELIKSDKTANIIYSDTGNIAVDSIINYKLCNAALNEIDVDTDIIIPNELPIEIFDLSTILTNLLDNSLQALQKLKTNRKLSVKITYKKGLLIIKIKNTYNGIVEYENGELITTKDNKAEHGYGMKNVNEAVEKYNGICQIEHNEQFFEVKVLLYVNNLI